MISHAARQARNIATPTFIPGRGLLLQRKCDCGTHTMGGGQCAECAKNKTDLQRKLTIGASNDPLEREADQIADQVMAASAHSAVSDAPLRIQRYAGQATGDVGTAPASVDRVLASPGRPLEPALRQDMEQRFSHDFSRVRVHSGGAAEQSAREVHANAYTVGHNIVFGAGRFAPDTHEGQRLIAHELTHAVQQRSHASTSSLQRKVILKGAEMMKKAREVFIKSKKWTNTKHAKAIIDDIADAADVFDFADENELESEIVKRVSTSEHMKESQDTVEKIPGDKQTAFGYPFSGQNILYGPRVNYAARDYWEPPVPDAYALRIDKKKNKELLSLARHERCKVYGDQCGLYNWNLSVKGKADPYEAIKKLFVSQPPHKRTLIHCDYLVSMVNFLSFADSIGASEFNKRVKAYGVDKIGLRWNAFQDLEAEFYETVKVGGKVTQVKKKGLGSLQRVTPSSEADLIIGDHVVFFNHLAYVPLNEGTGNAWRLENAVLIGKDGTGLDIFLGHGSGRRNSVELRAKLAEEFNDVAKLALALVDKTKSKDAKTSTQAESDLSKKFNVKPIGSEWHIQGKSDLCAIKPVNEKLRKIKGSDVLGPRDPCDPSKMFPVDRPIESAK